MDPDDRYRKEHVLKLWLFRNLVHLSYMSQLTQQLTEAGPEHRLKCGT